MLRYYPAGTRSLGYIAKESFKIKDVVIPEGELLAFNIYGSHFNKDQWKNPLEFRPERFDASSEYFTSPSGKGRHSLSYIPFTFGSRA